ncbi:site-2 protease family protein [Leptolyngbya sp. 'hensonii']|uniref:site-2 protease family protein n=1 Tax=Leptolyngbya sp. 'hensonii' TaxID=1922337 RepID=UPI00095020CA|nr:site-2 protease family protein [Leptolyngbya sp. 'hensonii']OLP19120.1 site-2 protease family protein [Leptolyngbya sp. 'hensonii']
MTLPLLFLLLLGLFTYYIVQRSVAGITRTPVWLLWLVMMMPTFIWSAWALLNNGSTSMPPELMLGSFIICLPLYWFLVQLGRRDVRSSVKPAESQPQSQGSTDLTPEVPTTQPAARDNTASPRPIDKTEEATLQNCFPWTVYYLQSIDYKAQAIICRGQLRATSEVAYETVRKNVETYFGDRFLLVFQEGFSNKPFFVLVPNPQAQQNRKEKVESLYRPGLALGLLLATGLTTALVGTAIVLEQPISSSFFDRVASNPALLLSGLPYAIALLIILGIHELGHYLVAQYYQLKTTLPYFIPIPFFLGTFGAFIQIRSPIPNRKVLFDVGIAGPIAGLVVTLPILLWGLAHSAIVPMPSEADMLDFDPLNPKSFLLLTILSKIALGSSLTANTAIKLNPVAIAGCIGLLVTALNLMPVGQLDGGHIVHAMFGQRTGAVIGQISRILVLLLPLALQDIRLLPWAALLFFMPIFDEPALNDVSELDNFRDFWGLVALGILLIIILPTPGIVSRALL